MSGVQTIGGIARITQTTLNGSLYGKSSGFPIGYPQFPGQAVLVDSQSFGTDYWITGYQASLVGQCSISNTSLQARPSGSYPWPVLGMLVLGIQTPLYALPQNVTPILQNPQGVSVSEPLFTIQAWGGYLPASVVGPGRDESIVGSAVATRSFETGFAVYLPANKQVSLYLALQGTTVLDMGIFNVTLDLVQVTPN